MTNYETTETLNVAFDTLIEAHAWVQYVAAKTGNPEHVAEVGRVRAAIFALLPANEHAEVAALLAEHERGAQVRVAEEED